MRNQIIQVVSFLIAFNAKFPKRKFMVNVKRTARFGLSFAAALAGKVVSFAGQSSLLSPVWAVVRIITAAPIEIIFTGNKRIIEPLPFYLTGFFTESAALCVGLLDPKRRATLGANLVNPLLRLGPFASYFWSRDTLLGMGEINPKANAIAKMELGFIDLKCITPKGSAALITRYLNVYALSVFAQILNNTTSSVAFLRAMDSRPASIVPKLITALRAYFPDSRRILLALARAINLNAVSIARGVVGEIISAVRTSTSLFFHFHYLFVSYVNYSTRVL